LDPLLEREKNYGPSKARYDDHFAKKTALTLYEKKLIPLCNHANFQTRVPKVQTIDVSVICTQKVDFSP
jgi:hypothetical protein